MYRAENVTDYSEMSGNGLTHSEAGEMSAVCHAGCLITAGVKAVCSETQRQRPIAAQIIPNFSSKCCLPPRRRVPLRITHAEPDTQYPPR